MKAALPLAIRLVTASCHYSNTGPSGLPCCIPAVDLCFIGPHNLYNEKLMANSRFAPSQWETALLCNDVSHWLGASLESALKLYRSTWCLWDNTSLTHCGLEIYEPVFFFYLHPMMKIIDIFIEISFEYIPRSFNHYLNQWKLSSLMS